MTLNFTSAVPGTHPSLPLSARPVLSVRFPFLGFLASAKKGRRAKNYHPPPHSILKACSTVQRYTITAQSGNRAFRLYICISCDTTCRKIHRLHCHYAAKNMGCQTDRDVRQSVPIGPRGEGSRRRGKLSREMGQGRNR